METPCLFFYFVHQGPSTEVSSGLICVFLTELLTSLPILGRKLPARRFSAFGSICPALCKRFCRKDTGDTSSWHRGIKFKARPVECLDVACGLP